MVVKEYIGKFEKYGLGMFVHFGPYSVMGKGEWIKKIAAVPEAEYDALADKFNPRSDWAARLVNTAKAAGAKYVTLTARHHDGFSLYDTKGLSDYDSVHRGSGRDLTAEFVSACRKGGVVPFLYHTLLDWHEPLYRENFKKYLVYLRKSVEILCSSYGEIGGFWFDGMWDKPEADWEEDALYSTIRKYQPNAMIINNTGLSARGALGHPELDSVTFERGRPQPINMEGAPKYIASEMCETLYEHWGYCKNDFNCKSPAEIIEEFCACR
ncbi:MAG: alpha-L-fucosidase [Clostridia bacterium]|nr:alpha-L-fucosidase [Clostridia bacterium]